MSIFVRTLLVAALCGTSALSLTRSAGAAEPTAIELLKAGREGRAEWHAFPGFKADLVVTLDGQATRTPFVAEANGDQRLELPDVPEMAWFKRQLKSLVSHRMASAERDAEAEFADSELDHPLGRKIKLNDEQQSTYRVKGDVITEVDRLLGKTRFTLSVAEVVRNAEGKHLPRTYNVGYWDKESGKLTSSDTFYYEWTRIGKYDLPQKLLVISVGDNNRRTVKQIEFHNVELLSEVAAK